MAGEALAHVQGESLKASATLLREVYQLPVRQGYGGFTMRIFAVAVACVAVAGCVHNMGADLAQVDAPCSQQLTALQQVNCMEPAERVVWARDSPQTISLYEAFAQYRRRLAEAVNVERLPYNDYLQLTAAASAQLAAQQNQVVAQENRMAAAQAMQQFANGMAAYNRALAQAVAQQPPQTFHYDPPKREDTTCRPDAVDKTQIDCTTTKW
jgi:hypothetical protein